MGRIWKRVLGYGSVALMGYTLYTQYPEIRRYLKMERM